MQVEDDYNSTVISLSLNFMTTNESLKNDTVIWSSYSPSIYIILITFILLGIGTALGNFLIILAVALVRKLQTPSNLLIVSLASSDFLVAVIVLPFSSLQELNNGKWMFNKLICDIYISFDVLLCTASILNLCAISIDRYLVITRPLTYSLKRTPFLMALMIAVSWLLAALITIPPLFLTQGGENDAVNGTFSQNSAQQCGYSESIVYQISACLLAFYIPLTVMLVVYVRIFLLARRMHRSDIRHRLSTSPHIPILLTKGKVNVPSFKPPTVILNDVLSPSHPPSPPSLLPRPRLVSSPHSISEHLNNNHDLPCQQDHEKPPLNPEIEIAADNLMSPSDSQEAGGSEYKMQYLATPLSHGHFRCKSPSVPHNVYHGGMLMRKKHSIGSVTSQDERQFSPLRRMFVRENRPFSGLSNAPSMMLLGLRSNANEESSSSMPLNSSIFPSRKSHSISPFDKAGNRSIAQQNHQTKAVRTLGVIMGCFTLCWLPFFVLQSASTAMNIQGVDLFQNNVFKQLFTVFLWLGYANSFLNPIIYAKFNRDFRTPFKELLLFRCRHINSRLRSKAYNEQYGLHSSKIRKSSCLMNMSRGEADVSGLLSGTRRKSSDNLFTFSTTSGGDIALGKRGQRPRRGSSVTNVSLPLICSNNNNN